MARAGVCVGVGRKTRADSQRLPASNGKIFNFLAYTYTKLRIPVMQEKKNQREIQKASLAWINALNNT